ncbi:unnamed protein product, partial [Rotaria sp. Silwood2]
TKRRVDGESIKTLLNTLEFAFYTIQHKDMILTLTVKVPENTACY